MRERSEPFLSVIIPVYNVADYLDQCIDSLTSHRRDDLEFIFVDDGTPDACAAIVARAAQKDARIKLVQKQNGGCASARNKGLDEARGRYVGFVDGDDWVDNRFFDAMAEKGKQSSADIIQTNYTKYYQKEDCYAEVDESWMDECIDTENFRVLNRNRLMQHQPSIWRRIYAKEFLNANNIRFSESLSRFDDLPFQFLSLWHAETIARVNGVSYYYRLERSGQDVEVEDERLHVHFDIFEQLRVRLNADKNPLAFEALESVALATHRWGYEQIKAELKAEYKVLSKNCMKKNRVILAETRGTNYPLTAKLVRFRKQIEMYLGRVFQ